MANPATGTLDSLIASLYPEYYIQTYRGNLFHGTIDTGGVAIAAAGTTAGVALANPAGNKKNLVIVKVTLGLVSGTFVVGTIMHGVNTATAAAAVTGTAVVAIPGLAGANYSPTGKMLKTATLPVAQSALRPFAIKQATAATANWFQVTDDVAGQIILTPGATWSLFLVGADTTPLEIVGVTWIEFDL